MRFKNFGKWLTYGLFAGFLLACDPWEEHIKVSDSNLNLSVIEVLKKQDDLSAFVRILEKTGYDSVLIYAQAYTIFAPTNSAWSQSGIDTTDISLMRSYVKNHVAYQSFPLTSDAFTVGKIQMLNGKYLPVSGSAIDGISLKVKNLVAGNGVIHTIESVMSPKMNIWEYINQEDYKSSNQVQFLNAQSDSLMDMEWSYQLYLNDKGQPVYDTAWIQTNAWLSEYPLNCEDSSYTFILLDESSFTKLKTKYIPYFTIRDAIYVAEFNNYMTVKNDVTTLARVTAEITRDMILRPITLSGGEAAISVDGVTVRIPLNSIDLAYEASNGKVYQLMDIDVKMYNNKIKEVFIEGENYAYTNVPTTNISIRPKPWARGGFDVVLSGRDVNNVYSYGTTAPAYCTNRLNTYMAYTPILNSIPYRAYWMSYDDIAAHVTNSVNVPQKLFFSDAGSPRLTYTSSTGAVGYNFIDSVVFVGQNIAGNFAETQLMMWSTITTGTAAAINARTARIPLVSLPGYQIDQLPCFSYGAATLWVSNCTFTASGTNGGSLFLDYIRLVPVIDPDE